MKTSQMTTGNGYLFRACYSKSQPPSLMFDRDEEAREERKSFIMKEGKASDVPYWKAIGM